MKNLAKILLFICTFYPAAIQAQTYKIAPSGDTINFLDKNNVKQGVWITDNEGIRGEPAFQFRCYYINGAKDGAGYKYTTDGDLLEEAYYKYDNLDSVYKYYDRSRLVLSGYYKAVNPTNPYETYNAARNN
jgi:antitoxin component YwqK of YwqJK toxin-antitoxin module